jgi:tetratricopeptide (TPR) repeat protein
MMSHLPRMTGFLMSTALVLALGTFASDTLQTGRQQFEQGQFAAAAKTLEAGLAAKSQDAALHYWLGRAYYELRDVDRAFEHAERAVQLDPQNSDYHLWYGHACGRKAHRQRSLFLARRTKREFEEAVRLNPSSIPARRALVDYLSQAPWIAGGNDSEARRQADAVAALDPVEGHLALADYWSNNEKPDHAAAEFENALELKPSRIEPYMEAGEFFVDREDMVRLQKAVEGAEGLNAAEPRLQYYRGVLWILQGTRPAEAEQSLLKYVTSVTPRTGYPPRNAARLWLGRLYEKLNRCNDAVQQYRSVLVEEPKNGAALAGYKRATQKCK